MFPLISILLFTVLRQIRLTKYIIYIYVILFATLLSLVKNRLYEDDFFGYFEHYQSLINLGEITYYSQGAEFVLTILIMAIGLIKIDSIFFFSLYIKLITYALIIAFLLKYDKKRNLIVIFIAITASPNFIMYTDSFIRQTISLALILLCVAMEIKYRAIIFILAVATHLTAIAYAPILILNKIKLKHIFVILILSYMFDIVDYRFFSSVANILGMNDKLYFIEQIYLSGVLIDTKPSITTFIPAVLIIIISIITNKQHTEKDKLLINLFIWSIIMGNIVSEIPYASSRIAMLTMAYTTILYILLKGRTLIITSVVINGYLWIRFITRENPTMEMNFQNLVWPLSVNI